MVGHAYFFVNFMFIILSYLSLGVEIPFKELYSRIQTTHDVHLTTSTKDLLTNSQSYKIKRKSNVNVTIDTSTSKKPSKGTTKCGLSYIRCGKYPLTGLPVTMQTENKDFKKK